MDEGGSIAVLLQDTLVLADGPGVIQLFRTGEPFSAEHHE